MRKTRINKLFKKKAEILSNIVNSVVDENRDNIRDSLASSYNISNTNNIPTLTTSGLCLYRSYIFYKIYKEHITNIKWISGSYFVDCEKNNNLVGCGPELSKVQGGGSLIHHFFCCKKIGNKNVIIDPSAKYFPLAAQEINPPAKWLIRIPTKLIFEFETKIYPNYEYRIHLEGIDIGKKLIARTGGVVKGLIIECEDKYLKRIG